MKLKNKYFNKRANSGSLIFKKPYRLWVHMIIYIILSVLLLVALFVTVKSYKKYQQIIMESTASLTPQQLIEMLPLETTKMTMSQTLTDEQLSQLFFDKLQYNLLPLEEDVTLEAYYYDVKEEISYMNFTDGNQNYSLIAHTELDEINNKIELSFSKFEFGKYKIGLLGSYYRYKFGINDRIEMNFNDPGQLVYIDQVVIDDQQVICNYTYNMPVIMEHFESYKNYIDPNKVEIYTKGNVKVGDFVSMIKEVHGFSEEGIKTWVTLLRSDKQVLEKCALTLKEQGIRDICADFQIFYNNTLQPESLIEKSQNELDYALMQYHNNFSKMVLNYLYKYSDYEYMDDELLVGGMAIDAQNILSANGKGVLYGVELIINDEGISASYHIDGVESQKMILRKE